MNANQNKPYKFGDGLLYGQYNSM